MKAFKKIEFYETILKYAIDDYRTLIEKKADDRALRMQGEVLKRLTSELNRLLFLNDEL